MIRGLLVQPLFLPPFSPSCLKKFPHVIHLTLDPKHLVLCEKEPSHPSRNLFRLAQEPQAYAGEQSKRDPDTMRGLGFRV